MKGFKNVKAYIYGKGIITTNIGIEDDVIKYIGDDQSKITTPFPYDSDQVVLAGFIDQHIHGAGGSDAMDDDEKALSVIANCVAKEGTTSFLATTMTQSKENINKAMKAVKKYIDADKPDGARVLGVHLEGPFISTKHIGAQPFEYVATPSIQTFDEYNLNSGGNIKIVSLAPEVDGATQLIEHLDKIVRIFIAKSLGNLTDRQLFFSQKLLRFLDLKNSVILHNGSVFVLFENSLNKGFTVICLFRNIGKCDFPLNIALQNCCNISDKSVFKHDVIIKKANILLTVDPCTCHSNQNFLNTVFYQLLCSGE